MNTKQVSLIVWLTSFLLLPSCSKKIDPVIEALQKAEQCMEAHPDSALSILRAIPNPEQLQGKKQADYGLLMTQAIDKNYMPLESDSLIQLAIRYYEESNDDIGKGKAYFYYGRYFYMAKEYEKALDEFLKSKKKLDGSKHYKMLGLLAYYIGSVNLRKHIYDESLQDFEEALKYYSLIEDTLSMTYTLGDIGRIYLLKEEIDSAFYYYTSALKIASNKGLKSEASILQNLGVACRITGDYEKAEFYIHSSVNTKYAVPDYTKFLSLGILYFKMGKYDMAEEYLKKSLVSPKPENHSSAFSYLYKISLQKEDYESVVKYVDKCDSIRTELIKHKNWENVLHLQRKYDNERLKNENLHIRNISLLGVIFILIILIIAIYYYYRNSHNKRRIKDIESTISQNQKNMEGYKRELSELIESKLDHQKRIGELVGKITLLTNQNRDLTERLFILGREKVDLPDFDTDLYIVAFRTLLAIKNGVLNRKLTDQDINLLIMLFNFLYDGYIERLVGEFPGLTRHEIELCCLLKVQFTNQELCNSSNSTSESVRKSKTRLKISLGIPADGSLEEFLLKY